MKLKNKKEKLSFRDGVTGILESHFINLDPAQLDPLLDDLETFYNDTFRPNNKSPHFEYLVKQYMGVFFDLTGEKPEFNAIMGINLHRLSMALKNRFLHKKPTALWDLETCLRTHEEYYRYLFNKIPFMRRNFTPTMMYSRFTENISEMAEIAKREKNEEEARQKKMEKLTQ